MRVLYLPLEFSRFFSARKFPYPLSAGLADGFSKDIECITIPIPYHDCDMWIKHIALDDSIHFDQVWLEVVHSKLSKKFLEWIAKIAPVRVGFIVESLTIHPDEFESNPIGSQRRIDNLKQKLPYLTHMIVTDERDLNKFKIPTMLGIAHIPERLVKPPSGTTDNPIFYGTLYGDRSEFIHKMKDTLNINPISAEDSTGLPEQFDRLFASNDMMEYSDFCKRWIDIRSSLYSIWINHLYKLQGCAFLNPMHRTNVLSSRVIEGMAAGKPVISNKMNNAIDNIFIDGEEILYYESEEELKNCIDRLKKDSDFRFYIAEAARYNMLQNHTTEARVSQILKFVEEN